MRKRSRAVIAAAALGALLGGPPAGTGQEFADVEIETVEVARGLYMLRGRGGNVGLSVGEDGAFLVDDQYAPLTEKIRAAVRAVTDRPIRFVLNTHWHGDHTGGNENLGTAGALIVAHENVRRRMQAGQFMKLLGRDVPPAPAVALPAVTFAADITFHWNEHEIQAVHVMRAHTDGDTLVHFRSVDVLHMGDVFLSDTYPFIDTDSGGSIDGMIAAVERGLERAAANTRIIPGHGRLSDRAGLATFRDMLVTVRERIGDAVAAGRSVEDVLRSKPTADLDAAWGGGFVTPDAFVRAVYGSLAGER
ncbi:MAG: MBL fold metallo-hydrolase [Deltaproteobacteria bacterium]|nr:MAG: MBL fold metallo-hydrolase [Deltaproteobacteria bacterium]